MPLENWLYDNKLTAAYGSGRKVRLDHCDDLGVGLWHEKFGPAPAIKREKRSQGRTVYKYELGPDKLAWVSSLHGRKVGDATQLTLYKARIEAMRMAAGGSFFDATAQEFSHFVTGIGIEHPIENGFLWHRTLGVPYLPGSGVKGATLAYARDWARADDGELWRIFGCGPVERDEADEVAQRAGAPAKGAAGSVVFLDAIPIEPPTLAAEGLTPHGLGSGPPDDAGPTDPIGFLGVSNCVFRFTVLPRRLAGVNPASDIAQALEWLAATLRETGVGAKTKTGYGRFIPQRPPLVSTTTS